uniref:ExbD/TolR family protein n=1 Tax=Bartonella sp. AP4SXKL TaxID=3243496 RepID=UPI0035D0D292
KDRSLYVGDNLVNRTAFTEALLKETNQNLETKILIKADSEIDYGAVVDLLNQIRTVGYTKVGLMGLQKSSNAVAKGVASDGAAGMTDAVGENVTNGVGTATNDVVNANTSAMGTVSPVE